MKDLLGEPPGTETRNQELVKWLGRADELGSGMRNLLKYGKSYGGSDPEMIEGDLFRIVIKVPDGESAMVSKSGATGNASPIPVHDKAGEQVSAQVESALDSLKSVAKNKQELLLAMGLSNVYLNYKRHVAPMLENGLIEKTLPEKPRSSKQMYRLTAKGRYVLSTCNGGGK